MKKTFKLTHEKLNPERHLESIKHEIKKYIKRERRKDLPEDADFIDFDCRFGENKENSEEIHLSAINKSIDMAVSEKLDSVYIEIVSKPGFRKQDH